MEFVERRAFGSRTGVLSQPSCTFRPNGCSWLAGRKISSQAEPHSVSAVRGAPAERHGFGHDDAEKDQSQLDKA